MTIGKPCKYNSGFMCFKWGECEYPDLLTCLKTSVVAQARDIEHLKHRQMQKHSQASLKWRNQCFYYKRKCKLVELYTMEQGFALPSSEELESFAKMKLGHELKLKGKEEGDEGAVCSDDTKKVEPEGLPLQPREEPEVSRVKGNEAVHRIITGQGSRGKRKPKGTKV